jgi:hypothetical protein
MCKEAHNARLGLQRIPQIGIEEQDQSSSIPICCTAVRTFPVARPPSALVKPFNRRAAC